MAKLSVVGISGNLSAPSRTHTLVATTTERIARELDAVPRVIDVSVLPGLGNVRSRAGADPVVEQALRYVETADLIVAGSPVYKGSYTGLFKHFIDFVEYRALIGVPVALLATGGSERHALVVDYQLRPLFSFFQAQPLATGLFLTDRELANGEITEPALKARHDQLVREALDHLSRQTAPRHAAEAAA